eukprot:scaffold15410_cov74-Skeletonema_dohrnii-CCMP3373.AAC.4
MPSKFNRGGYIIRQMKFLRGCQTCMEVLLVRTVCQQTFKWFNRIPCHQSTRTDSHAAMY